MPATRRLWLLLTLAALTGLAPAAAAQEFYRPELTEKFLQESLRTDWYGVYLRGQKIGYLRGERRRDGDRIIDEQVMTMKLVSFGKKVEISSTQTMTFEGKAPYRMVGALLVEKNGPIEKKTTFTRDGETLVAVHEVGGQKRTQPLKGVDYTLADASATEVWVRGKPKVGDVIVTRSFDPGEMKMDVQTSKALAEKSSRAAGVRVHFYEVESESQLRQIKSLSRYDDQGNTLSATVVIFELRKETEETAKDTQYSQDLFVLGMVHIDQPVGDIHKAAELVVEINGKGNTVFEDGPRQSVTKGDDGKTVLRVGKKYGKDAKATEAEIKDALAETNNYPITHPKIKELAEKVTEGARTDAEKVAKIVAFVHKYVTPSLAANAPNIHDLLEKKKGDCKSYALLFNNLARAAGVPAREVSGLLYVGDDTKAFGGHAWNEVVLNGVWVPVDASLGETEVNATHLSFGTEHRATRNLLDSLGKLSLRLVEVKEK